MAAALCRSDKWQRPIDDNRSESDCGEEYLWAAIVTCRDGSPILEPAEHDLDTISALVAALVILDG